MRSDCRRRGHDTGRDSNGAPGNPAARANSVNSGAINVNKFWLACVLWAAGLSVAGAQQEAAAGSATTTGNGGPHAYIGADYGFMQLQVNRSSAAGDIPQGHYFGRLVDFRAGVRVHDMVEIEAHVGMNASGATANHFGFSRYYALFAVPTATMFDTVELSVPMGYVWSGARARGARASLNSVAFGANLAVPVRVLLPTLPDVRIVGGGLVSVQRSNAQIYGFHLGLRYDFGLSFLGRLGG